MTDPIRDQSDEDLEELMLELGRTRYRNRAAKASIRGRRTDTKSGRAMLREAVHALESAIRQYKSAAKKRAGAGHSSASLVAKLHPAVVAFLTARTVLDGVALQQPLTALANSVGRAVEEEVGMKAVRRAARSVVKERKAGVGLDRAQGKSGKTSLWPDVKKRLRRNARGSPYSKKRIVKDVAARSGMSLGDAWPRRDRIRLGVTLVELLRVHTGLIEICTVPRPGRRPHAVVQATSKALNWMEQADARNEVMTPVYLPMRTRPADWTDPWTGGYRLNAMLRRPVVKTRQREQVSAVERADPKLVYRAISSVQRTPWRVNQGVYKVAKALWDSGAPVAGFAERLDDPAPGRPAEGADTEAVNKYHRARADWRKRYNQNRGQRVMVAKTMHLAGVHLKAPEFYFPHQADFRGRLYPTPFFLQPQGNDLARGLLQFAKGKVVRDRDAAEYFKAAGAGLFGVNRVAQSQRILWAAGHQQQILAAATDPLGCRWWLEAESPFQFLAWAFEYADWTASPARFPSRFAVPLDGSCNGLQLYSLLVRDEVGGAATNVVDAESPRDIYQDVADRATAALLQDQADPENARKWLEFLGGSVPRSVVKRPTMTQVYGSTFHSAVNYIRDEYEALRAGGRPTPFDELDGGGYRACSYLGVHVWAAIEGTVGKARAAMAWLRAASDVLSKVDRPVKWTAPSGWPVVQRYTRYESARIQTCVGDQVRFVRYREDTDTIAPVQQANGVAPNFIHSIDASILAFAICRAREEGIDSFTVVHDSFGTHAADTAAMARVLRSTVADVFAIDLLAALKVELEGQLPDGVTLPPLPEYGTLDIELARGARYFYA